MSRFRAQVNLMGIGAAALVVARWEKELGSRHPAAESGWTSFPQST